MRLILVKRYFVIALLFLSFACSSDQVKIPNYVIQPDSMVPILTDLHITDAYLAINRSRESNAVKKTFYKSVFSNHGVSKQDFDTSILFYTAHPEVYEAIYDKVMAELSTRMAKYEQEQSQEKARIRDSLTYVKTTPEGDTVFDEGKTKEFMLTIEEAKKRKKIRQMKAKEKAGIEDQE